MPGSFFRNVGAVAAVRVSGGALLFASQLLLAVWMGASAFGAYSVAWAWVAVLATLAGLGLPGTSVRFIARYRVEGDGARLRGLLRFGRAVVLTAGTVLAVLGIALAPLVVTDAAYVGALQLAFVAIPILALLNLDAAYARGFDWMAMSAVAEQILRPVILLLLAVTGRLILSLFGAEFVAAYPALLILIAGHVLAAAFGPLTSVLMMTGRHRAAAVIHAASLPVQALLSVSLIGSLGVRGAALAAATGLLLTQFVLYVIASRRAGS